MSDPHVLYVEDDILLNIDLSATLEDAGFSLISAYSYPDAIAVLSGLVGLSVLLTDVDLGQGPGGLELANYARGLHPELPVVFVSGSTDARRAAHQLPGAIFVAKPFDPARIVEALDKAIRA